MKKYHKINSIFKRDECGKFIIGDYSTPEFEYLANNRWRWDEKIDGMNLRIIFENNKLTFGGKTDNAQIPTKLVNALQDLFSVEKFKKVFPDANNVCLYGEGYGNKIQSGGKYRNDQSFVLFDVLVEDWILKRTDIEDVSFKLGIDIAPIVGYGTLSEAISLTKKGFNSEWGDFIAEGLVLRPETDLFSCSGKKRIITKIKHNDFK